MYDEKEKIIIIITKRLRGRTPPKTPPLSPPKKSNNNSIYIGIPTTNVEHVNGENLVIAVYYICMAL